MSNSLTRTLPTGEFVEVSQIDPDHCDDWQVVYWSSEADYLADKAEAGEWSDRATCSVAVSTREEALAELDDSGSA